MSLSIGSPESSSAVPADYNLLIAVINGNETQAAKLKELRAAQTTAEAALADLSLGKAATQALADAEAERAEAHTLLASIQENHAATIEAARIAAAAIIDAANATHDAASKNASDLVEQGKIESERLITDAQAKMRAAIEAQARADDALKEVEVARAEVNAAGSAAVTAKIHYEDAMHRLQRKLDILNAAIFQATSEES